MEFNFEKLSNELLIAIIKQLIPVGINVIRRILRNVTNKNNVEWQLLSCMQETHRIACEELHWEYSDESFYEIVNNIARYNRNIFNRDIFVNILSEAVGQRVNFDETEIWINSFLRELALEKYTILRNYIEFKLIFKNENNYDTREEYIKKFEQVIFNNKDYEFKLKDIYIPNNYCLFGDDFARNDLLTLVDNYINGSINEWLDNNKINYCNNNDNYDRHEILALIIYGYQGMGKSTLMSKIIYDHIFNTHLNNKSIYIVSFNDLDFRVNIKNNNNLLTPNGICNYLGKDVRILTNSTLLLDGFDESGIPSGEATRAIEILMNSLKRYKCKLIVTSRYHYLYTNDLFSSLDIYLQPFSTEQAQIWLNYYSSINEDIDINNKIHEIESLTEQQKKVVLIPHIFFLCILYNIELNSLNGIAHLYNIIFIDNYYNILRTRYNFTDRNLENECIALRNIITEISFEYIISNKITEYYLNIKSANYNIDKTKIVTEFFMRKEGENFYFIHDSIPYFFVAKLLFEDFININDERDEYFINDINVFCTKNLNIPLGLYDYLDYFVRNHQYCVIEKALNMLKLFLSGEIKFQWIKTNNYLKLQEYYYLYFKNLFQIIMSLISSTLLPFETFNLFNKLSPCECEQLVKCLNLNDYSLDFISNCTLKNINLNNMNFKGINLRSKTLVNSVMRNANFDNSDISGSYLLNSDFTLATFNNTNCMNADFTNSILFGASFIKANLNGCNLTNTTLNCADFRGAKIRKCKFDGASLLGAKFSTDQLVIRYDFNIDFIKYNGIKIYQDESLLNENELEEFIKNCHPVSFHNIF